MIINVNTNRRTLTTWSQARTWCHVWWLAVIGGLDVGTLEREDVRKLTRRFCARLLKVLDIQGFHPCPYHREPHDEHRKVIADVHEMVAVAVRNPEKVSSWREFAYGVSNALAEGAIFAPPCRRYPGIEGKGPWK